MSSGVHWAEWIVPIVGAQHALYNAAAQGAGAPDAKLTTPDSKQDKINAATEAAEARDADQRQRLGDQAAEEESRRALLQPDRVRDRAAASASLLGQTGRRRTASQYLAGV
jgi:hypothetical protein